jgi:Cof subfamily protein (haloacid dehalogenase superfamily)
MNKLYISDLDGTLLKPDATITDSSKQRLQRLIDQRLHFTVASARSVASMREILSGMRFNMPIIESNGAYLSDLESGNHFDIEVIEPAIAEAAYELTSRSGCHPFITFFDGQHDHTYYHSVWNDGMLWYVNDRKNANDSKVRTHPRPEEAFNHQVTCMVLIGTHETLEPINHAFAERLDGCVQRHFYENMYEPGWWWLSIHPERATKADAISRLLHHESSREAHLVVFGDHNNDIEMFKLADEAIAVENATEDLKSHADLIIGPNTTDSVIDYIERDFGR